jgi:hypothetical protein
MAIRSRKSGGARGTAARAALTTAGAVASAALAVALAACADAVVAGGLRQVDEVVELAVVGLGALVAAWLAVSAAVAAVCLLLRLAGATWRSGERAVHRFAPAIVRRSLVVAVTAGLGAGLAPSAYAAPAPSATAAIGTTVAAVVPDLGWVVTVPVAHGAGDGAVDVATGGADADGTVGAVGAAVTTGPVDAAGRTPAGAPGPTTGAATEARRQPEAARPGARPASGAVDGASPASPGPGSGSGVGPGSDGADRTRSRSTAGAAPTEAAANAAPGRPEARAADGSRTPDTDDTARTAGEVGTTAPSGAPASAGRRTVVVRAGDSLWRIAARHLPAGADDAAIAAAWPAWYHANRMTIGDDPGLLLPGQVLVLPDGVAR